VAVLTIASKLEPRPEIKETIECMTNNIIQG
jgi:hypothetical protein